MVEATLTGFSGFLDWRPLRFLKPLPRAWTCDVCGLMSQTTVVPECLHVFCSDCYQRLLSKKSPKCPMDMLDVNADDTKKFALGDNQRKLLLVQCLNAEHGCKFEGPFGDLEAHYTKDCNFHVVTCKRCGSTYFRTELLEHLEKDCRAQFEDVTPHLIQKPVPGQISDSNDDRDCKSIEIIADLVKSTVEDNSNVLIESMKQCTAELAKNLVEATQYCMKSADDSKKVTSSLAEPMQQYILDVMELKKLLAATTKALVDISKQRDTALCRSCGKIPKCWLALGFLPGGLCPQKYVFTCTNIAAKVAGAPAVKKSSHVYPFRCPRGNASIKGRGVKICLLVSKDASERNVIRFNLTFLGESQNSGPDMDMMLVLVHPTDASLNQCRPLKIDEIFKSQSKVDGFAFFADVLCRDGFVADDMLLVCLETAE